MTLIKGLEMNQLNAVDASIYILNSQDQNRLSISTNFLNRVLERTTGYVLFVAPFDHSESICLDAHVRRELEVMVGANSSMSNNFISCIKYAAANSISIIVFDEDAPIPNCVSIEGKEHSFHQDDRIQFDAKENV